VCDVQIFYFDPEPIRSKMMAEMYLTSQMPDLPHQTYGLLQDITRYRSLEEMLNEVVIVQNSGEQSSSFNSKYLPLIKSLTFFFTNTKMELITFGLNEKELSSPSEK